MFHLCPLMLQFRAVRYFGPISVSDIIKLLDEIPIWKNVAVLPRRLAALEERLAELQSAKRALPAPPMIDPGKACPMCGAGMKVLSETAHPTFGFAGVKVHKMECPECEYKTTRDFSPGTGYK